MALDAKIPGGPIAEKWDRHRFELKLVNPANKRKFTIIVVGTGLAGGSAAATLAELGYNVKNLLHPGQPPRGPTASPPRAASTRPKTTPTTATASGGCFTTRSKAAISGPGRPTSTAWPRSATTSSTSAWPRAFPLPGTTAGLLANRSFGGAQVSRTFYARGQTGQQLLLGAYSA
jgi:succinate dehydrogenase / fumarate reductase flavoprotein subunit